MTDEQFEKILQRALAPEIDDTEIVIRKKKARSYSMKSVHRIAAVAACAALIVGAGIGGDIFLRSRSDNTSLAENSFILKVNAEELEPGHEVPIVFEGQPGWSLSSDEGDAGVSYCVSTGVFCEGESIETVTYSINKGAFGVLEANDGDESLIKNAQEYDGETNFPMIVPSASSSSEDASGEVKYYTEYTVDYDSQNDLFVSICGNVSGENIENKVFDPSDTAEEQAAAYSELMSGVEITCTVRYSDGTTADETIVIEGQMIPVSELSKPLDPDSDPDEKMPVFVYKIR